MEAGSDSVRCVAGLRECPLGLTTRLVRAGAGSSSPWVAKHMHVLVSSALARSLPRPPSPLFPCRRSISLCGACFLIVFVWGNTYLEISEFWLGSTTLKASSTSMCLTQFSRVLSKFELRSTEFGLRSTKFGWVSAQCGLISTKHGRLRQNSDWCRPCFGRCRPLSANFVEIWANLGHLARRNEARSGTMFEQHRGCGGQRRRWCHSPVAVGIWSQERSGCQAISQHAGRGHSGRRAKKWRRKPGLPSRRRAWATERGCRRSLPLSLRPACASGSQELSGRQFPAPSSIGPLENRCTQKACTTRSRAGWIFVCILSA